MAKKYRNVETKISPITIGAILLFIISMITLVLVLQPKKEETLTDNYLRNGANSALTDEKYQLKEDNNFVVIDQLSNQWLGLQKGLNHQIAKDELTIVFFANTTNTTAVGSIAYVHYYLYTYEATKALGESVANIIHFNASEGTGKNSLETIFEKITKKFDLEEDTLTTSGVPALVAFKNGKVEKALTSNLTPNTIKDFYSDLLNPDK